MECARCKRVIESNMKFCPYCGEPINDKQQNRINKVIKWVLTPLTCYFAIIVITILLNGTFYSLSTQFQKCTNQGDILEGDVSAYNIQPTLTKLSEHECIILRTFVYTRIPILFPGIISTKQLQFGYGQTAIKIENIDNDFVAYGDKFGEYGKEIIDECHPRLENGGYFAIDKQFVSRMVEASIEDGLNETTHTIKILAFIFSIPIIILCLIRVILIRHLKRYCINCGYKNNFLVDKCSNCGVSMKGIEQKKIDKKLINTASCSKPILNAEMAKILAITGCIIVAIGIFWIYSETQKQDKIDPINTNQSDHSYQIPFTGRNGICRHKEPYTGEKCKCTEYRAGVGGKCSYCGHSFTEHE